MSPSLTAGSRLSIPTRPASTCPRSLPSRRHSRRFRRVGRTRGRRLRSPHSREETESQETFPARVQQSVDQPASGRRPERGDCGHTFKFDACGFRWLGERWTADEEKANVEIIVHGRRKHGARRHIPSKVKQCNSTQRDVT